MTSDKSPATRFFAALAAVWPLLVIGVLVALAAVGAEPVRLALRYDSLAIASGEWWRLISGHIVHLGWKHVLLNLAGLGLVILLFPREYRPGQWLVLTLVCVAAISAGFVVLRSDLSWYVGLSGVLHGFFVAGAIRWISRREPEGYVLAAFLVGKLVWEQLNGALPMSVSSSGGPVVVDAHLYGAVAGAAVALVFLRDWNSRPR